MAGYTVRLVRIRIRTNKIKYRNKRNAEREGKRDRGLNMVWLNSYKLSQNIVM